MTGRVCVVTGATRGIGRATAEALAGLGATLVLVARRLEDGEKVAAELERAHHRRAEVVEADLSVQASIKEAAAQIRRRHPVVHVLINNAGIITRRREVTADGLERQFAVNYLAYFLLTNLLLGTLKAGAPSRIVNVSSGAHAEAIIDFDDLQSERQYKPVRAYAQAKLADILFTYELARRLAGTGVMVNCLHPGVIATKLLADYVGAPVSAASRLFGRSPERGAQTVIYLAASPEVEGITGRYFERCREARSSPASYDERAAQRLWQASELLTGMV